MKSFKACIVTFRIAMTAMCGLLVLLAGCGYQVIHSAGTAQLLAGKTIHVPLAINRTYRAGLEGVLTDALIDQFGRRGAARLAQAGDSELVLAATINAYSSSPRAYSASDRPVSYLSTLDVTATLSGRSDGKVLWQGTVVRSQEFPANVNLALQQNHEEAAFAELCQGIARDIMSRLTLAF